MKKRIILILAILGVLTVIVGGTWAYLRRGTGWRLLNRAQLAVRAGKYAEAVDLAEKYAKQYPSKWDGYYWQAVALIRQGQYDQAQAFLKGVEARTDVDADKVALKMLLADTYAHPARRALATGRVARDMEELKKQREQRDWLATANTQLQEALELEKAKTDEAKSHAADILQSTGINLLSIAKAYRTEAEYHRQQAKTHEAARNAKDAEDSKKEAVRAEQEVGPLEYQAADNLLKAVEADPSREEAARDLVRIAFNRRDRDPRFLEGARKELLPAVLMDDGDASKEASLKAQLEATPCPVAAMLLVLDARGNRTQHGLEKATGDLEVLIAKHPDQEELKLHRAQLAERLGQFKEALGLCDDVLKKNSRQPEARLLRGRMLVALGRLVEAKQELFELKTEFRRSAVAGLAYANAALASSRAAAARGDADLARQDKELAVQEMRRVVSPDVDPKNAEALVFLAGSLLADGFAEQAYQDARKLYEAYQEARECDADLREGPSEAFLPEAVNLYVRTALATDQPTLVRPALEEALKEHGDNAAMLMAVLQGFEAIEDKTHRKDIIGKMADCEPRMAEECLAVARARIDLRRYAEAETLLLKWADPAQSVPSPTVSAMLGELYMATGRPLLAKERFEAALKDDPTNQKYQKSLAKAFLESGLPEDAERALEHVDAKDEEAALIRYQVRLAQGEGAPGESVPEGMLQSAGGAIELALVNLRAGRFDQCIAICQAELNKQPDQPNVRWMLARALSLSGQKDKALSEFKRLLAEAPGQLSLYRQLAAIAAPDGDVSKLRSALSDMATARPDLMALACGQVLESQKRFDQAAKVYQGAIDQSADLPVAQNQARLLLARALAASGKTDEALAELDRLGREKGWAQQVAVQKALFLLTAGRAEQAQPVLVQLKEMAAKGEVGTASLRSIVQLLVRAGGHETALALCQAFQKRYPADPEPFLVEAEVLVAARRADEAAAVLEQAIAQQPDNTRAYLVLARIYDAIGRPADVMSTLDRLKARGQATRVLALDTQGRMFAGWGLQDQAVTCFEEIARLESRTPEMDLNLGRALATLGRREEAVEVLSGIPTYSRAYLPAQQIVVQLTEPLEAQLALLAELEKRVPGRSEVLDQRMRLLIGNGRSADAVSAYRAFAQQAGNDRQPPVQLARLAVEAMLQAGDRRAALELAGQTYQQTKDPQWQTAQALFRSFIDPAGVKDDLPPPDKAGLFQTWVGISAAGQAGQSERLTAWLSQLEWMRQRAAQAKPPQSLPPSHDVLVALTVGDAEKARAISSSGNLGAVSRSQFQELIEHVAKAPQGRAESARLLGILTAAELGFRSMAGDEAMAMLKARPQCQLAASIAFGIRPAGAEEILGPLRPADCLLAQMLKASVLSQQKKYAEAAELMAGAMSAAGPDNELVMSRATFLEYAGQLDEALELYRQVWRQSANPIAGNNAAYLLARLKGDDPAALKEAAEIAEKVVARSGGTAGFRDTLGWICLLRGDLDRARKELRLALRALSATPEVHYHLGLAEKQSGQTELARWHLEAAVAHNKALAAKGANTKASDEAADAAGKALAALPASAP